MSALAINYTHNPAAGMALGEKLFIQPAMVQLLSRPKVIRKATETTPVIVLAGGMLMWVSRVAQLKQAQPVPPAPHLETDDQAQSGTAYQEPAMPGYPEDDGPESYEWAVSPDEEPANGMSNEPLQDNAEIVAALQEIRLN